MHAQLGLPGKGRSIKGLVVCNSLNVSVLDGIHYKIMTKGIEKISFIHWLRTSL